ncbi:MAG: Uma2 family endonuclease [Planctomycetota bacterium]
MSTIDTPAAPPAPAAAVPPRGAVTLAMYDRMIAAGVFEPRHEHPLELVDGVLQMMSPIGDRHADAVDWLVRWSMVAIDPSRILVRVQNPIAIPASESAPQPDLAWVTLRRYTDRRPLPGEVLLVVEVADTSLDYDTTTKAALYAAAGIGEYWVIDLVARAVIVFRDPVAGRYDTRTTHRAGRPLHPVACPDATLEPAELFVD